MATTTRTDTNIWPLLPAADAVALRSWLARIGFDEGVLVTNDDGNVQHSEMLWPEGGRLMVATADPTNDHHRGGPGSASIYVVVGDPDGVHRRARDLGAEIARPLEDTDYGSRGFTVRDPEGNSISFGTYSG
ncbi:VOC family protein [Luteipulveratus flavus]|uniref:VOC family protein n=1 Tax=Luteipulveratus flavus TaxID=3031728 RepID=A0ABT6C9R9_9MICO|nr:VOC family protein [Luteipulveratus sp. YIM 133296]MDF8265650.1 VOC family protein [Luteipulveratus sp. YIM 133296]